MSKVQKLNVFKVAQKWTQIPLARGLFFFPLNLGGWLLLNGFPCGLVVKNLPVNAGDIRDASSIFGSGRSLGEERGNPFQYSCLENPLDRSLEGYSP